MFSGKFGSPEVWVTRFRSVMALSHSMSGAGRYRLALSSTLTTPSATAFAKTNPVKTFVDGTEPELGIAVGTLFAADHLRAEAEDLRSGFCDKAYDKAGRLVERSSGGVHKTRSDSIEDHRDTLIGHHTVAVLLPELRSEAETGWRNFGQLTGLRIARDSKRKGGKKEK